MPARSSPVAELESAIMETAERLALRKEALKLAVNHLKGPRYTTDAAKITTLAEAFYTFMTRSS